MESNDERLAREVCESIGKFGKGVSLDESPAAKITGQTLIEIDTLTMRYTVRVRTTYGKYRMVIYQEDER